MYMYTDKVPFKQLFFREDAILAFLTKMVYESDIFGLYYDDCIMEFSKIMYMYMYTDKVPFKQLFF